MVEALRKHAPRALHVGELCKRVGATKTQRDEMLDVLDELHGLGLVTEMPGNRYRIKAAPKPKTAKRYGVITGVLQMTPRGFGFVDAADGESDVFIPPTGVGPALHGDRVEVAARPSPKGREGDVVAVLQRRPARFTGTLMKIKRQLLIEPDDARLRGPMPVTQSVKKQRAEGLSVVAEIEEFPQSAHDVPKARVVEVLGVEGMTRVEVAKIKIRENVIEEFDDAVREEAEAFPRQVLKSEKKEREDLRDLDLVTIDPADARDHDDAIFCEKTKNGYRVVVAIADVSHYVRPGTALDRAALERGCSIYLPDRAIPMLPPELSSHLASLVAHKDRLCMGAEMHLSANGALKKARLFEGVMRSGAGLTYPGVAKALGLTDQGPRQPAAEQRVKSLRSLLELSQKLRKRRLKRGALDFDLPEARIELDSENVEPIDVRRSKSDPGVRQAYQMVEEMMLLTNEVVATELKKRNVPGVYRCHGRPDEKKLALFAQLATALGFEMSVESAADPRQLAQFLKRTEKRDEAPILRFLLLRAMQQAYYDVNADIGHFGLATKDYLHFTSPIRRYPDLVVHRVVRKVIRGEPIDRVALVPNLRRASAESSRLERRAMNVERDVVALYRSILMRDRVEEEFEGTISSIDYYGFRVTFDEPFVDAFVPITRLKDFYEVDDLGIRLIGQRSGEIFALGDRIEVRLESVSIQNREITAVPVDVALSDGDEDVKRSERPPRRAPKDPKGRGKREQRRGRKAQQRRQAERPKKNKKKRQPRKRRR